jgi:hypothetical protein
MVTDRAKTTIPPIECRPTYRRWRRETALRMGRSQYSRCEIARRVGPTEYRRRQIALRIGRRDRCCRREIARGIGPNEYRTCQIALRTDSIDHPLRAASMYPSFPRSLAPGLTTQRRALPPVEVNDPRLARWTRHAPSHVVSATHPDEWCAWLDWDVREDAPAAGKSGGRSGLLLPAEGAAGSLTRRSSVSPLSCLSDRG